MAAILKTLLNKFKINEQTEITLPNGTFVKCCYKNSKIGFYKLSQIAQPTFALELNRTNNLIYITTTNLNNYTIDIDKCLVILNDIDIEFGDSKTNTELITKIVELCDKTLEELKCNKIQTLTNKQKLINQIVELL